MMGVRGGLGRVCRCWRWSKSAGSRSRARGRQWTACASAWRASWARSGRACAGSARARRWPVPYPWGVSRVCGGAAAQAEPTLVAGPSVAFVALSGSGGVRRACHVLARCWPICSCPSVQLAVDTAQWARWPVLAVARRTASMVSWSFPQPEKRGALWHDRSSVPIKVHASQCWKTLRTGCDLNWLSCKSWEHGSAPQASVF